MGTQVDQEKLKALAAELAKDIKSGDRGAARKKIDEYREVQKEVNKVVASPKVQQNLEVDLDDLEKTLRDSFSGTASEQMLKQKKHSKTLGFDAYGERRSKN